MYDIDIKDELYFIVISVVDLELLGKMACFIDSKYPIHVSSTHAIPFFPTTFLQLDAVNNLKTVNVTKHISCWGSYSTFYLVFRSVSSHILRRIP